MDIFSKNRLTTWTVILLVILNLVMISTIWLMKHRRSPQPPSSFARERMDINRFLKRELKLSDAQLAQIKEMREQYKIRSKTIGEEIHELRKLAGDELFRSDPDTLKLRRYVEEIGIKFEDLEWVFVSYFQDLGSVCQPHQQKKLKKLFNDLLREIKPTQVTKKPPGGRAPGKR